MNKIYSYIFPTLIGVLLLAGLMGYVHISSSGESQLNNHDVISDKVYLSENKDLYADCHYTVEVKDLSTTNVKVEYSIKGFDRAKLDLLEAKFKENYEPKCKILIDEYRIRYSQFEKHKRNAAEAELSQLDKWLGKEAKVISEPSPIFSLYQEYDPKSLQYPTNHNAKMLYQEKDYENFVEQNL